ncbi:3 beta-hydroxysteroid dehydrogenase/Delta 5--_4-isomerase type 1 [Cimex lectularius]|uniref:3-beta hydroxysteroid dehydrogenase/isomerase domain-containing protein n=1 Tax=Cimex lectularius TaxID=79782 RepID=A0A8I6R6X3_CIMLE|nr:3 beta-hydroxysteroid dehydrogenase/Delta 5-->4-isomerase type 1 [Cimex lectularius]
MDKQIVLITGGAGFLGQHLIREIQERQDDIKEIRVVDLIKHENKINYKENIPVISYICDISSMNEKCKEAFRDVRTVFHCAAYISYDFPPDKAKLNHNNVEGTRNVIEACLENKVSSLIYTSSAEVCMKPYFNNGFFSIIINQTESKELPPMEEDQLVFGSYAASKLKGEELILSADNMRHFSGDSRLRTTALRPTFMYGEEDNGIFKKIMQIGNEYCNNILWRIGGAGGRHQFVYAGNVAWAHIKAKIALEDDAESVGGLPVFITDDTSLSDQFRFCELLTESDGESVFKRSAWSVPSLLSFLLAFVFELAYGVLFKIFSLNRIPFSPKGFIIYLGSAVFFSRLRAILHLAYSPLYTPVKAKLKSQEYYLLLCTNGLSNNYKSVNYKSF